MKVVTQSQFVWVMIILLMLGKTALGEEGEDFSSIEELSQGLTHYTMALVYDFYGYEQKAILEFKKSAQLDHDNYLIHLKLGTNYARLGLLDEAIRELRKVFKLNPTDIQSHYLLALIYSTQKDFDKAAQEYETVLKSFSESDPQNIEIYGYLGQLYYSQNKFPQAIEQFEKILTFEPKNAEVMYLLGTLYLELQNKQKGTALFHRSSIFRTFWFVSIKWIW